MLGDHVAQKGSLVAPDRLRFDFAQPRPLTPDELRRVEDVANAVILAGRARRDPRHGARRGAGERRARPVRREIWRRGARRLDGRRTGQGANKPFSIELCGGTHVGRTGEIGLLAITSESGVASGVRRIEALTGQCGARPSQRPERGARATSPSASKCRKEEVGARVADLVEERRRLERELAELRRKLVAGSGASGAAAREVGGIAFLGLVLDGVPAGELKGLIDERKRELGSGVAAIVTRAADGKATLAVGVTEDLVDRCDAVSLVKAGAAALGGRGGGRPARPRPGRRA